MTSSIKRKYRKIYSTFMATLMLVQNFVPALFVFAPSKVLAQDSSTLIGEVDFSINENNEFELYVESDTNVPYLFTYFGEDSETEKAILGEATFNENLASAIEFAGICSADSVCVEDEVSYGVLTLPKDNFKSDFIVENDELWLVSDLSSTITTVELGKTYSYPNNNEVEITFTKLPENPGSLTIEEITLSDEQVEQLGALSNIAFDITSDMEDGNFEYDLKLPLPEDANETAGMIYAESVEELSKAIAVESDFIEGNKVMAIGLDHFTVFVVTINPAADCTGGVYAAGVCYATVQEAITSANSGDTIEIKAGTHFTTGQIVIDKNLSIEGEDKNTTILKPTANISGGGSSDTSSWLLVNPGVEFNLSGVTIDGDAPTISMCRLLTTYGTGTIEDNIFKNVKCSTYDGRSIVVFGDVVIQDNYFENFQRIGIHIRKAYSGLAIGTAEVINNTFFGKGDGNWLDYAVEVGASSYAKIESNTISDCRGVALSDGSTSAGILVTDYYGVGTTIDILSNTLQDNSAGIYVGYDDADLTIANIHQNKFLNNVTAGVIATSNTNVDATNNWWGDATGPFDDDNTDGSTPVDNLGGLGDDVIGPVDYSDWASNSSFDTTAPATPTDIRILNNISTDLSCGGYTANRYITVDWSDNSEDDFDKYEYQIREETTIAHPTVSEFSGNIRDEDGDYKYRVRALDTTGNASDWTEWCGVTLDRVAPATPIQTGYNENNGDAYSIPRPINELACTGDSTNINGISIHWTDVADGNTTVRYQRQYNVGTGSWSGNEIYTSPYTNYRSFGGGSGNENTYGSRVRAWKDYNGNKIIDSNEMVSDWSNECEVTYDKTAPAVPTGLRRLARNDHNIVFACGDTAQIQGMHPDWDDNAEDDFDYYEYSSFNAPNGAIGIDERRFDDSIFEYMGSWLPTEGTYGFAVRAVDKTGNRSAWAVGGTETLADSCQITYDSTAPSTPEVLGFLSPDLDCGVVTNIHNTTVDWTDSIDLGIGFDRYEYNIDYPKPDGTRGQWTTFMTPSQYSGSLNEGTHHIKVRGIDSLGNTSDWSNTCSITADWTAPEAPTLVEPANNAVVNGTTLFSDWTTVSDADHYIYESYHDAGAANLRWHAEYSASEKTANNVANSTFWWRVKAVDLAGNESDWSDLWKVTIDNDSPNVLVTNPGAGIVSGVVDIRGTVEDDNPDHYWFVIQNSSNATVAGPGVVNDTNSFINQSLLNWDTTAVDDGIYKIKLEARDAAGNKDSGSVSWIEVIVDNTTPSSTITTFNLANGGETQTSVFDGLVEGTAADGSGSGIDYVLLSISHLDFGADESETKYWDATGSAWVNTTSTFRANGTTSWDYQLTDVPEGIYNVTSHAVDLAGNVENTYTIKIVYDKTIPEVVLTIDPTNPDGSNGWYKTNPSITLTASDNYSLDYIEYQWNSTADSWTTYSAAINPPGEGQNILYYRSIDTVGNVSDLGIKEVKYDATAPVESPLSVRVENIGSTTATGKWDKPENADDIHEYRLSWKHKETGKEYSTTVDLNIFEHELDNLFDGLWEFKVFAVDSAGNSKSASTDFRVGPEPEVLGVTTESQPETFVGVLGQVAGVFSNNQAADETDSEENDSSEEKVVAEDGQVAGVSDDICGAWESYLPLILLILQVVLLLATEIMNREASLKKILMMMGLSLLTIALFYVLKKPTCYIDGSMMSFINKWFVMISLGLSILIKFAASISIEDK